MENLNHFFKYEDGKLFWKISNNQVEVGDEAGKVDSSGYKRFVFQGKRVLVHRIVYELLFGECPKYLDHIDGNKLNNYISNLRPVTAQQNAWNRRSSRELPKNVYQRGPNQFRVAIRLGNYLKNFGTYPTVEQAVEIATMIRQKYHGEYAV